MQALKQKYLPGKLGFENSTFKSRKHEISFLEAFFAS